MTRASSQFVLALLAGVAGTVGVVDPSGVVDSDGIRADTTFEAVTELERMARCVGGVWVGSQRLQDQAGDAFVLLKECRWAPGGTSIRVHQRLLYENGSTSPLAEHLTLWDPDAETARSLGVFANGGVIRNALFAPESLVTDSMVLDFEFVPVGGPPEEWRSVMVYLDPDTQTEVGLRWDGREWVPQSSVRYRRVDVVRGAATFQWAVGSVDSG